MYQEVEGCLFGSEQENHYGPIILSPFRLRYTPDSSFGRVAKKRRVVSFGVQIGSKFFTPFSETKSYRISFFIPTALPTLNRGKIFNQSKTNETDESCKGF